MSIIYKNSIKIKNYKCFGEDAQGFESIYPINVIIGKNNAGKSTLIDLIELLKTNNQSIGGTQKNGRLPEIIVTDALTEDAINTAFSNVLRNWLKPGYTELDYGKHFINDKVEYSIVNQRKNFIRLYKQYEDNAHDNFRRSILQLKYPLSEYHTFLRINADRDIVPESESNDKTVLPNGSGATNLSWQVITNSEHERKIIEKDLLYALNSITSPDMTFIDIIVQKVTNNKWEIYLETDKGITIPLSKMGSGIKTIILILLNILVIPKALYGKESNLILGFEELENNLHPSLQRRLFNYLANFAKEKNSIFFITTHSSLLIDLFATNPDAQILLVTKGKESSTVTTVSAKDSGKQILTELGVKPSDVLLSNGVIWVEGPSDALYLEFFLRLYIEEKKLDRPERLNYSIQALATAIWKYAGFYTYEIDFTKEDVQNKIIELSKINHNHLIVLDRDNNYEDKRPSEWQTFENGTGKNKAKLIHESLNFTAHNEADLENNFGDAKNDFLYFWVTPGTFESYLEFFIENKGKNDFKKYFDITKERSYFEKLREGDNSSISKVLLANEICKFAIDGNLTFSDFDSEKSGLSLKIQRLYNTIKSWNFAN
jgi:putative ATP-dependent endonuclease of the OLD family